MTKRWQNAGLAVLAVLTAGAVVGAVRANSGDNPTPAQVVAAQPTADAVPTPVARPVALWLGDSYTHSHGATDPSKGYVQLVSDAKNWQPVVQAEDGTGYATAGPYAGNAPYVARLNTVVAARPEIVIVGGGRNDTPVSPDVEAAAVRTVFETLHARLPAAHVYAMSPLWDASTPPSSLAAIAADVQSSCAANGCTYLDLGQPLAGHPEWLYVDKGHPNDLGYGAIARAVEAKLPSG